MRGSWVFGLLDLTSAEANPDDHWWGWESEYAAFRKRSLADWNYVYVWVDGVHFRIRPEDDRLCTLVMIVVGPDGTKELVRRSGHA